MDNTLYIVSFGDSRQYRMRFDGDEKALLQSPLIKEIEKKSVDYIKSKESQGSHACRFATPTVEAVASGDEGKYSDLPVLDAAAIPEIEKILFTEVEDMRSLRELNRNAPFDDSSSN